MAVTSFRIDQEGVVHTAANLDEAKYKGIGPNREAAVHRETGEPLRTVSLLAHRAEDNTADLRKVSVPESGVPEGLHVGMPVHPVNLVASVWVRHDPGNCGDGVVYSADALKPLTAPAPVKAVPAADQMKAAGGAK
ncbi:hypothetical protein [Streptomyces yunnanensis]|uniref:Uncharacterized protein n=1 Tax=Streptomyces yunnanensis TaxID=156453 RepID=A0A9X8QRU0_9ACTN|nr:hypothetical protein [Streptomyces yunnanensis]SHL60959.1 hypothetical protein SAMN05216268_105244 [Streptomyces yunnanensis]